MKSKLVLLAIFLFSLVNSGKSNGADCFTADPFCTRTTYNFPNSTITPNLETLGCLITSTNPAWHYLEIVTKTEKDGITFKLSNPTGSVINFDKHIVALEKSDFSCFRFKQYRRVLFFEDGVQVELFSIDELIKNGNEPKSACFTEYSPNLNELILQLVNNTILIAVSTENTKSQIKPTK